MNEIDLTKPLQLALDNGWADVVFVRKMCDGDYIVEYEADEDMEWRIVLSADANKYLRNKPEPRVRPYTFEESRALIGKPVVDCDGNFSVIVHIKTHENARWPLFRVSLDDHQRTADAMLSMYRHPDGTPFGVIEHE